MTGGAICRRPFPYSIKGVLVDCVQGGASGDPEWGEKQQLEYKV